MILKQMLPTTSVIKYFFIYDIKTNDNNNKCIAKYIFMMLKQMMPTKSLN